MKRKIQLMVKSPIYAFEVDENFNMKDENAIQEALAEHLEKNNISAKNEFFENIKAVWSKK